MADSAPEPGTARNGYGAFQVSQTDRTDSDFSGLIRSVQNQPMTGLAVQSLIGRHVAQVGFRLEG